MVSLPFSAKFVPLVIDGTKKQSMRLLRNMWKKIYRNWLNGKEYNLQFYENFRTPDVSKIIPDEPLKKMQPIYLRDITKKVALDDGFTTLEECIQWFRKTYKVDFSTQLLIIIFW